MFSATTRVRFFVTVLAWPPSSLGKLFAGGDGVLAEENKPDEHSPESDSTQRVLRKVSREWTDHCEEDVRLNCLAGSLEFRI